MKEGFNVYVLILKTSEISYLHSRDHSVFIGNKHQEKAKRVAKHKRKSNL